jgi:hypothetical protein
MESIPSCRAELQDGGSAILAAHCNEEMVGMHVPQIQIIQAGNCGIYMILLNYDAGLGCAMNNFHSRLPTSQQRGLQVHHAMPEPGELRVICSANTANSQQELIRDRQRSMKF